MGGSSRARDTKYLKINEAGDPIGADVGMAAGKKLGVGVPTPLAQCHVDQNSGSGAVPVLTVDQADTSEEFIRFIGTSHTDNSMSLVDAVDLTTPGAIAGWVKIYVTDIKASDGITDGAYFVPFYATPTA